VRGIFFKEQAEALAVSGYQVGVIYPELRSLRTLGQGHLTTGYRSEMEGPVVVHRYYGFRPPKLHRLNRRRWIAHAERLYGRYVAEHGIPDLLHAHCAVWAGVAAARVSRATGVGYVLTEHSTGFARGVFRTWHHHYIREAFGKALAVIAVSEPLRHQMAAYCRVGDIRVVANLVDTETFCLPPRPRAGHPFRFVCIAFLHANKAVDLLVRAFADAFGGDASVLLDIVGDGAERVPLERLVRSLELDDQVIFHGMLGRAAVRDTLWSAHCCVSSSDIETFGVTLIEALATGLPIIATRSGGPEGIVTPDNGHLVPVRNVPALAEAMRAVYAAREHWQHRSEALGTFAEQRYGRAAIVGRLDAVYREVLRARDTTDRRDVP
jgi:glycosyltransferase involved in cell wall biosynthesis